MALRTNLSLERGSYWKAIRLSLYSLVLITKDEHWQYFSPVKFLSLEMTGKIDGQIDDNNLPWA